MQIDWFQVITVLLRRAYSLSSVASGIRVPRSALIGWKQSAEPRYSEEELLISFWVQVTGGDRAATPMVALGDWWAYHSKA
ncbi:hypothetical protein ACDH60_01710 [Pseudomonas ficuserectae]|uniref:Uncharacterized protein n=2 Tax=Pseudomonas amygdali pv. lachrymans TaxID=53707 RepID=A0AB37QZV0_PSEAV|nr:hypothetical protein [Pseudomonas amygdali]ARA79893.1 hypothetical protein B5U27_07345 [Pseudomonas amygdali pv. lachrymans]AXH57105.1 hypothetical protein PLA107_018725 [Pseudomonas amygdali pv. lachrymans str. M301315]KKY58776.1 hypothetical protein AAY85_08950 [Pseudomonas amygdali pv. lachrymans]KPB98990.1 Uncharacterized protein AC501_3973 [Pseudomonas amygdali pv. lachrymans]KPC16541.1 Uncharacterized protein AC499_6419 [Pseudomonas amygdali pv. lachrymans]